MMIRLALALVLTAPISTAFAQGGADHAQRIAAEVALRRAQVRALQKCEMEARPATPTERPQTTVRRLPAYPPTGTGGPVRTRSCPPDFHGMN